MKCMGQSHDGRIGPHFRQHLAIIGKEFRLRELFQQTLGAVTIQVGGANQLKIILNLF